MIMKRMLITGCQRSGTTLMGLIMNSHPLIKNVDEADFKSVDDFSSNFNSCAKLPQQSANLNFIKDVYNPDSIIWMVRNPFDVIKSMMSLQVSRGRSRTESWGSTYSHVEISKMLQFLPRDLLQPHEKLLDQYRATLANTLLRSSDQGNIIACITCWVLKQECCKYLNDSGLNVIVVRYEDLVCSPGVILPKLFKDIGVEWHDDVLRHHELHNGYSIGNTLNSRSIDRSSLFYSSGFFSVKELEQLSEIAFEAIDAFDYPIFKNNDEFKQVLEHSNESIELNNPSLMLFELSSAVNQRDSLRLLDILIIILKFVDLPVSVLKDIASYLGDEWVVDVLLNNDDVELIFSILKLFDRAKLDGVDVFIRTLTDKEPVWCMYFTSLTGELYPDQLSVFYGCDDIIHPKFASALAMLIGREGSILEREEQWTCLVNLDSCYPNVTSIRLVAINLSNTMPAREEVSLILKEWSNDMDSITSFRKSLFNFSPKHKVVVTESEVSEFEITNIETLYMAWRLSRGEQIKELSESEHKLSAISQNFLCSPNHLDFAGSDRLYFGGENPEKLIVVFTGMASMLMYPPALVHALIDLPPGVGVLWLQDVNARGYMSGPDGKSTPYKYEEYVVDLIREIGPSQVSVIGSSAGGTISLHFASIFPVYKSVSLSPYTFLEVGGNKDRLEASFSGIFGGRIDLLPELGKMRPITKVYYGADCKRDKENVDRLIQFENMTLVPVLGAASHHTGEQLALQGLFCDMFNWLVEGDANEPFWKGPSGEGAS
jgi:hypothetical protein